MELAKEKYRVTDYSISQTTLDDVFISFAKKQGELEDAQRYSTETEF